MTSEQSLHFKQIRAVLKKTGFEWADDIVHTPFGMMLQDGKKMSTRKERVILLEDVLNKAIDLSRKIIKDKNPYLENKEEVARQVGIGAVILHDLKHFRTNDVDFSLDSMLNFGGETGPYLQYTNVRCHSLIRKANYTSPTNNLEINEDKAWPVIVLLGEFDNVVRKAWKGFDPSKIARYALDLARSFNQYYANVRILSEEKQQASRLNLVHAVQTVLEESLRLLNIKSPKQM